MSESSPTGVTPSQAGQLLRLRAMLDRAATAARVNAPLDAGTTAVLLDAVNDRAAHLVAVSRGDIQVGRNDSFIELYSKLCQAMPWWKFGSFADVRQLHNARNQAQHEGLEPAREHIPGWASVTRAFASSLVQAHFGVRLDRVHLSDALDADGPAHSLRHAEDALDRHEPQLAVRLASEAFTEAVGTWRAASQRSPAPNFAPKDLMTDATAKSIHSADAAVVHGAFATDPAELVWFTRARNEPDLCDAEDARRAVAFVFWWLVGWQRFEAANIDRYMRAMQQRRRRRHSLESRAHIAEVLDFRRGFGFEDWEVTALIADVPTHDSVFDLWTHHLAELMSDACPSLWIEGDGTVKFRTTAADFDIVIAILGRAVVEAEELAERTLQSLAQAAEEREEALTAFTSAYEARREDFPAWVQHVTTTSGFGLDGDCPALELIDLPQSIRSVVHDAFGNTQVWGAIDGNWGMTLPLDIEQVLEACRRADVVIGPALQVVTAEAGERQQARQAAWGTLSEVLRRHGVAPPTEPPERQLPRW